MLNMEHNECFKKTESLLKGMSLLNLIASKIRKFSSFNLFTLNWPSSMKQAKGHLPFYACGLFYLDILDDSISHQRGV